MAKIRSNTVALDIQSYQTGADLLRGEAGRIFLHLEDKPFIEVAYLFGLDRYFSTEPSMRGAITRAFNLVLDNPESYDIPSEKAAFIQGVVSQRAIMKPVATTLREEADAKELKDMNLGETVLESRNLATRLVRRKLDHLDRNPKALKEMSLKELIGAFHILFDKGQIIQGAATEHIAILSNISSDMSPDEALGAVMKMREQMIVKG